MRIPTTMALGVYVLLSACTAREGNDEGTDTATSDTSSSSGDTPTTGVDVDPCDPQLPPIPEGEFAERFATAICEQKSACGCTVDFNCPIDLLPEFASIRDDGTNLGLTYDGACAARKLAGLLQSRGCDMASAIDVTPACTLDCLVYRGDVPPASACTLPPKLLTAFFADTCAAPGSCSGTTCEPPLPTVADGQPCVTPLARCEAGSACDYADSKTCEPQVGLGAACIGASVCSPQFYCADGLCSERQPAGSACTADDPCGARRCTDNMCEDWVWICEVQEGVDIFARDPADF